MMLLISFLRFLIPAAAMAFYTSEVSAPGSIFVGDITPEAFLTLTSHEKTGAVEGVLVNSGFEEDLFGYIGGIAIPSFEMLHEGVLLKTIQPPEAQKMLEISGDLIEQESGTTFWINKKVAGLRLKANMISNSNKLISQSEMIVRVNGSDVIRKDLGTPNPESYTDGIPRDSGFFEIFVNLLNEPVPTKVEIVNKKDSSLLVPDLTLLIDDLSTNVAFTNNQGTFDISKTGRPMPYSFYDYGNGYLSGDTFTLPDGEYNLSFFTKNDLGSTSATKSAWVKVFTNVTPVVDDLGAVMISTTSAQLKFSLNRNFDLVGKIIGSGECEKIATASSLFTYPIKSDGLFEVLSVQKQDCYSIVVSDQYDNIGGFSNFAP